MLRLNKYSIGVGDRFARQAGAQLAAVQHAAQHGVLVTPVWNKSHREHLIVGSGPAETRQAADQAVRRAGYKGPYFLDADHINLATVDSYLETCDFFTIDVADAIGQPADQQAVDQFVRRHPELVGQIDVVGLEQVLETNPEQIEQTARHYLRAVQQAGEIYRHIVTAKGAGNFVTEVSMDETHCPQTPVELLVILAALADERLPLQTIAPKFVGRFNKGVDYVGRIEEFAQEFDADLAVVAHAVENYELPSTLKLSVHSGSDKFSLYPVISRCLKEHDAGLHLKTAGTTWLEELIGLAEAGGDALQLAKEIAAAALDKIDQLCQPYAEVIDIDPAELPSQSQLSAWQSEQFIAALRHDPTSPNFNASFRQLLHVGYKLAAQRSDRYHSLVSTCEPAIAANVTANLYRRHIVPLFLQS